MWDNLRENPEVLWGFVVALGVVDDFRGLPWWGKLGGQSAAAAIAIGFGVQIDRFTFPVLGIHDLPEWVGVPATFIWIVAIMNPRIRRREEAARAERKTA